MSNKQILKKSKTHCLCHGKKKLERNETKPDERKSNSNLLLQLDEKAVDIPH